MNVSSIKIQSARNSDLNIVEDMLNLISEQVYGGPQFLNMKQLTQKLKIIIDNVNQYDRENVLCLYKSLRSRLCTVLYKRGICKMSNVLM